MPRLSMRGTMDVETGHAPSALPMQKRIFWLIFTPGLWIGSGGTLGWLCHIISAYMAYTYAEQNRNRY